MYSRIVGGRLISGNQALPRIDSEQLLDMNFKVVIISGGEGHELSDNHSKVSQVFYSSSFCDFGLFSVPAPPFRFLKQNGGVFSLKY